MSEKIMPKSHKHAKAPWRKWDAQDDATPENWTFDTCDEYLIITSADHKEVAQVVMYGAETEEDWDAIWGNVSLIIAAPELLEAASVVREVDDIWLRDWQRVLGPDVVLSSEAQCRLHTLRLVVNRALEKAGGGSPPSTPPPLSPAEKEDLDYLVKEAAIGLGREVGPAVEKVFRDRIPLRTARDVNTGNGVAIVLNVDYRVRAIPDRITRIDFGGTPYTSSGFVKTTAVNVLSVVSDNASLLASLEEVVWERCAACDPKFAAEGCVDCPDVQRARALIEKAKGGGQP